MAKNVVRVRLRGGLGNQLFQYAAGFELSDRLGLDLVLDCSLLPKEEISSGGVTRWPEQISSFNFAGTIVAGEPSVRNYWIKTRAAQLERAVGDRLPSLMYRFGRYAHERLDPVAPLLGSKPPININAYCNSPLLFSSVADALRAQLRNLSEASDWFLETQEFVTNASPIAVHLRLGDYRNLASVYGELGSHYFEASKRVVERLSGSREYLVFSDEPHLAKEFFGQTSLNAEIVHTPRHSRPLESVLLMSQCAGLIASNSSFSWWSGYLMEDSSKPIIFPRPLFKTDNRPEPKNWLLNDWLQLGNH